MTYISEESSLVLKNVSFSLEPGQKLGIVGRTGRLVLIYLVTWDAPPSQRWP